VATAGAAIAIAVAGSGGGGPHVVTTPPGSIGRVTTKTETARTETTPPSETQTTTAGMTQVSGPNLRAEVPDGWQQTAFERAAGSRESESRWEQQGAEPAYLLIDTHTPTHLSPEADAAPVHEQTAREAGYRENRYESTSLSGTPAWEWDFEVEGDERLAYYFEACGHVYGVLGSAAPLHFSSVSGYFEDAARSIAAKCPGSDAQ
jgi:hypothetical protein